MGMSEVIPPRIAEVRTGDGGVGLTIAGTTFMGWSMDDAAALVGLAVRAYPDVDAARLALMDYCGYITITTVS